MGGPAPEGGERRIRWGRRSEEREEKREWEAQRMRGGREVDLCGGGEEGGEEGRSRGSDAGNEMSGRAAQCRGGER